MRYYENNDNDNDNASVPPDAGRRPIAKSRCCPPSQLSRILHKSAVPFVHHLGWKRGGGVGGG